MDPPSVGREGCGGEVEGVEHLNAQLEKGNSDPPLQSADSLCDCQEALHRDRDHDEDRAAEAQPGEWQLSALRFTDREGSGRWGRC